MNKKITVSVGIPAYNEQKNIGELLRRILAQKQKSWKLAEVLVYSDGSRDRTADIARSIGNKNVVVFEFRQRRGQQVRQNEMLRRYTGELLILVEADTLPLNENTIENLVSSYKSNKGDELGMIVGVDIASEPASFFESVVYVWNDIKQKTFDEYKNGDNLYNSGGHTMRAITAGFAGRLHFPTDVPEDTYCYLRLKELGLKMVRAKNAKILINTISSSKDRLSHSKRFYRGRVRLSRYFDEELIKSEYLVPKGLLIMKIGESFRKSPFLTLAAVVEFLIVLARYGSSQMRVSRTQSISIEKI